MMTTLTTLITSAVSATSTGSAAASTSNTTSTTKSKTTNINLRDLYPEYELDCIIEILNEDVDSYTRLLTEEIAQIFFEEELKRLADLRRMYRYKAQYSLDVGDGIEHEILEQADDTLTEVMRMIEIEELGKALESISTIQAKRIYAHYILGISKSAIAKREGVHKVSVSNSISCGLQNLKKFFEVKKAF